jgi:hypothetical protein
MKDRNKKGATQFIEMGERVARKASDRFRWGKGRKGSEHLRHSRAKDALLRYLFV